MNAWPFDPPAPTRCPRCGGRLALNWCVAHGDVDAAPLDPETEAALRAEVRNIHPGRRRRGPSLSGVQL